MAKFRTILMAASALLIFTTSAAPAHCVEFNAKSGHLAVGAEYKATGRLELSPFYVGDGAANLRKFYGGVGRYAFVLVLDEPVLMGSNEVSDTKACEYPKLTVEIQSSQTEETLNALVGRRVEITGKVSPAQNSDQIIDNGVITYSSAIRLKR